MASSRTVRDPHEPVNTGLGLQPAIGVVTLNAHGNGFDPRLFAGAFLDHLQLETATLAPAAVHAHQHGSPVLCLGAAGAGMDFKEAVITIGFTRKQAFELSFFGKDNKPGNHLGLGDNLLVTLHLAKLDQPGGVIQFRLQRG